MKLRGKNRAFTLMECIFAISILSLISATFLFSMIHFSKMKNENIKEIMSYSDIENVVDNIKNNIHNKKEITTNIDTKKYKLNLEKLDDMYFVEITVIVNGEEKVYEMYVCEKN